MGNPSKITRLLALTVAIGVGIAVAWYQRSRDSTPVPEPPPPSADTRFTPRAPAPSSRTGSQPDHPSTGTAAAGDVTGDAPTAAASEPSDVDPSPEPAPLPEFLAGGLGPPQRAPDGTLVEGSAHDLQLRLDQEPRDTEWAEQVEWELENYLGLQPFTERLENLNVLCRTTVCRVTAVTDRAALPDSPEDGWQGMMSRLRYERVSQEFDHSAEVVVFKASAPDRVGFVTYFERRR